MVLLFDAKATAVSAGGSMDAPVHGALGAGHLAFAVRANEVDLWISYLTENGVEIEREIQFGKSRSIYFRDPSGNSLEITSPLLWGIPEDTLPSGA